MIHAVFSRKRWSAQTSKESKGTIEREWILGGKPGFEGIGLLGYDNAQKKYTLNWISNMGTGTSTGLGDSSGRNLTFQTEAFCPIRMKMIKGRDELRIENNDKVVLITYLIEDGKETKTMELVSTRQK